MRSTIDNVGYKWYTRKFCTACNNELLKSAEYFNGGVCPICGKRTGHFVAGYWIKTSRIEPAVMSKVIWYDPRTWWRKVIKPAQWVDYVDEHD